MLELRRRGIPVRVATRPPGRVGARRALAGISPGGAAAPRVARLVRGLLGEERGSALPLVVGAAFAVVFIAVVLAALGGAVTGGARAQRAADLAALSAARSMRDDLPELLSPPLLPGGAPNPAHMSKVKYLTRARRAALQAGELNGVDTARLRIRFPDGGSLAPVRARVTLLASIDPAAVPGGAGGGDASGSRRDLDVEFSAEAEAAAPDGFTGTETVAGGGGYAGPLAYRQGQPMRPDVAAAFDRLAAAAAREGVALAITSAYRSDAEQARLFAQNPDPRWVAPPGRSLHRCATELDLGPAAAYSWLAQNAPRFGFRKRYSWEAWHYELR